MLRAGRSKYSVLRGRGRSEKKLPTVICIHISLNQASRKSAPASPFPWDTAVPKLCHLYQG